MGVYAHRSFDLESLVIRCRPRFVYISHPRKGDWISPLGPLRFVASSNGLLPLCCSTDRRSIDPPRIETLPTELLCQIFEFMCASDESMVRSQSTILAIMLSNKRIYSVGLAYLYRNVCLKSLQKSVSFFDVLPTSRPSCSAFAVRGRVSQVSPRNWMATRVWVFTSWTYRIWR